MLVHVQSAGRITHTAFASLQGAAWLARGNSPSLLDAMLLLLTMVVTTLMHEWASVDFAARLSYRTRRLESSRAGSAKWRAPGGGSSGRNLWKVTLVVLLFTSLTHLNISNITKHFTAPHIRGLRPNCETEWANPDPKHHRLPHTRVPWDKVWESLGTPISDATEERHWRKLLHRGTFVRNKQSDKSKPTTCRMLGCHKEESMLHIVTCQKLKPFWDLVFNFIATVIGDPPPRSRPDAIIFNMWNRDDLGSEPACAFLRHAFGCFYDAFSKVDLEQKLFSTPLVFHKTLLSFRSAVLRYAHTIRILYLQRRYTTLRTKLPPKEACDRFKALVVIQDTFYDFELSTAFTQAISDDEATLPVHQAHAQARVNPGAAGPS